MQAAYASILDLPLEAVPDFAGVPDTPETGNAHTRADDFLATLGLTRFRFSFYADGVATERFMHAFDCSKVKHCLLSVPSQKFEGGSHVVVGRMGVDEYRLEVAHDPNPENGPYDLVLTPPRAATLIVKLL